jgi:molybdopterin-guanine dinucleotide biosynthesis protein A
MQAKQPLYGLVVCGGESSRMGMDKSLLVYHEKPQRYHLYDMLLQVCDRVFISCSVKQSNAIEPAYEVITDLPEYAGNGPIAGVLSAFTKFGKADFLIVACDYPFVSPAELRLLARARDESRDPVCFYNPDTKFDEPLLAVYVSDTFEHLKNNFSNEQYSLRQFLKGVNARRITPQRIEALSSIDTPEAYRQALDRIHLHTARV